MTTMAVLWDGRYLLVAGSSGIPPESARQAIEAIARKAVARH